MVFMSILQVHSQSLNAASAHVKILLVSYQRFAIKRFSSANHSSKTIHHNNGRCSSVDIVTFGQGFRLNRKSFNFKSYKIDSYELST